MPVGRVVKSRRGKYPALICQPQHRRFEECSLQPQQNSCYGKSPLNPPQGDVFGLST